MRAAPAAARALLERVFACEALAREYPLVFDARFDGATVELEEEGAPRAACTILVREFVVGGERLRGGLIGSVATDPAWRGRGLATRLLARAEEELRARGCLFALLWATDPRFYLARGYAPLGGERDFLLVSELTASLPEPSGVRALRPEDVPVLHRLHARHPSRVERSLEEFRALLDVPGMLTLVRERRAHPAHPPLPVAYACLGRGRDLADTLHDWAGAPEDVLALVRAHLERRFPEGATGALFLMAPLDAHELAYRLVRLGAVTRPGILGLGKLLDLPAASALLGAALGSPAAVAFDGAHTRLRGPTAAADLEPETLQALLFGAPDVAEEARGLLARLGFAPRALPLEPFAFGLDSI
ncbi:MAG TPA: GNAT family N-acetyltransferase [Planctomycetota bacterium]